LTNNLQVCKETLDKCTTNGDEGIALAKKSGSTLEKDLTKTDNLRKYFGGAVKAMESVQSDLEKVSGLASTLVEKEGQWESETKLKLKVGKPVLVSALSKVDAARKASEKTSAHFTAVFEKFDKTKSKTFAKELDSKLRALISDLQTADRAGKNAERLLKQAREAGDREAEKYLRYAPTPRVPSQQQQQNIVVTSN